MAKRKNPERDPCNEMEPATCGWCGRVWYPPYENRYREDGKQFDKWSCLCAYRRARDQKKARRGRSDISAVEMLSKEGERITFFPSARAAGEAMGIDPQNIRAACSGRKSFCGGYMWRWAPGSPAEKRAIIKVGCILQSYGDAEKKKEREE